MLLTFSRDVPGLSENHENIDDTAFHKFRLILVGGFLAGMMSLIILPWLIVSTVRDSNLYQDEEVGSGPTTVSWSSKTENIQHPIQETASTPFINYMHISYPRKEWDYCLLINV